MVGGALQERECAAVVSALSVAAADGDLRDALPEAAVPIIDVVGLPDILEELVGLEETSLVEQPDSSPASLPGGAHDLFRFSIVVQLIPASTGKRAKDPDGSSISPTIRISTIWHRFAGSSFNP